MATLIPALINSQTSITHSMVNLTEECTQPYHSTHKKYVDYNLLGLKIVNSNNYHCTLSDSVVTGAPPNSDWNLYLPQIPSAYPNKSKVIYVINQASGIGRQFHVRPPHGYKFFKNYSYIRVTGGRIAYFVYIGDNVWYAASGTAITSNTWDILEGK